MTMNQTFEFERDFAGSLRCVPMAVRLKLDLCGIKLSLRQWSQLGFAHRDWLLRSLCANPRDIDALRTELARRIELHTDEPVVYLASDERPAWRDTAQVPHKVREMARRQGAMPPTVAQWSALSELQRFSLLKLTREGHENANFVPAMREFGLRDVPEAVA